MKKTIFISMAGLILLFAGYVILQVNRAGGVDDLVASQCSKTCQYEGPDFPDADQITQQPGAQAGEFVKCPVSGVVVKVSEYTHSVTYNGETYYTCCMACARIAENAPSDYLSGEGSGRL